MEWDKFRMAQKFLQRANAIHPEDVDGSGARSASLAMQDVYYDCYMSSFSRDVLLRRLEEVADGKFELPETEEVDESVYKATYIREAGKIFKSIESGELK